MGRGQGRDGNKNMNRTMRERNSERVEVMIHMKGPVFILLWRGRAAKYYC